MIKYVLWLLPLFAGAQNEYPASLFGIRSDAVTLNTRSIQYAVDFINAKGGGTLVFEVGQYLTGSIHLKSNVHIRLNEGAVLLGSLNPFDYDKNRFTALLLADSAQNISITGRGVINGRGRQVANNVVALIHSGIINDPLKQDRANETIRPMLIYFRGCSHVTIRGITLKDAACWVNTYDQCSDVLLDSVTVNSKAYWNNDGIDIVDCKNTSITNCFIDAADDGVCLKSHDAATRCDSIVIRNCTIRSSASAVKFGTASLGGFTRVHIINNKVYDTYRSAIAIEAVDGGIVNGVVIDSLYAANTGNAIFLRVGNRWANKPGSMHNITISNMEVYIAKGKADEGYDYEGPVEDQPRNTCPVVMTGLPGAPLTGVYLYNVAIHYPAGGNRFVARRSVDELDSIPELPARYPEFSMFKELPAWGFYIRHARRLSMNNVAVYNAAKDYRPAVVTDDVQDAQFEKTTIKIAGNGLPFFQHNSKNITIK